MSKPLKPRRGTTAQNNATAGVAYEISYDTDKNTLVCRDGVTPGGFPLARADEVAAKDAAQDAAISTAQNTANAAGQAAANAQTSANAAQTSANAAQTSADAANQGLVGVVRTVNGEAADAAGGINGVGYPKRSVVNISVPSSGGSYVAPGNGFVCYYATTSNPSGYVELVNISSGHISTSSSFGKEGAGTLRGFVPCLKGDTVEFFYNNIETWQTVRFAYGG